MDELTFVVTGEAEPGGSKKGFVHPHTKQVVVVDANKKLKPWQQEVKRQVLEQLDGRPLLLEGPIEVTFRFYLPRPQGHFGAHGILPSARPWPSVRPDVLKLSRGVEDALTEIVWKDDAQIVIEHLEKHYGEEPRVEIAVREIETAAPAPHEEQLALV